MLVRSTFTRHRIRHGIRHADVLAGRRPRPCVANDRLRHMLIGSARVSKADGSQVVAAQDEGVAQPFLSATPSTDGRGRRER